MKTKLSHLFQSIGTTFINGLITILPIMITIWVFSFCFRIIKGLLAPLTTLPFPLVHKIPHAEIIVGIIVVFFAGIFLKSFIFRSFVELLELIVHQVPLVRPVYRGVKQLVHAFSPSDKESFQRVVLIEFPHTGMYSIGFQTNELVDDLAPEKNQKFFNVFVPITPNPTHGFFVLVKEQDIISTKLTTQEAMTIIISGGIVQPHRFEK